MSVIGSPRNTEQQTEGQGEASCRKRHRPQRSQQSADADGSCQIAHLGCGSVENIKDGDHDQDVQAAADEALRNPKADEQPSSGCARNRRETRLQSVVAPSDLRPQLG